MNDTFSKETDTIMDGNNKCQKSEKGEWVREDEAEDEAKDEGEDLG